VAVASNFATVIDDIAADFERDSGHALSISLGSTGKQFAQILNGAPFDVFLAADVERPRRLEAAGHAMPGSRFTYAIGRLVVWAPQHDRLEMPADLAAPGSADHTNDASLPRIAIANPRLAPYGRAAEQTLVSLGLLSQVRSQLVRGENISQAFQFVYSGHAAIGFVAESQLVAQGRAIGGARWEVPANLHDPIAQQAVLLRQTDAGQAFMDYLRSDKVRQAIRDAGYRLP
jgi:molybdate transport system substrate-binding protein